ncbi:MAG TPA: DUF1343 domain-containing protein [Planctomycetota bacterium]|nr:DUF1343 domain-containing protein [Planctomycetota bacterium]
MDKRFYASGRGGRFLTLVLFAGALLAGCAASRSGPRSGLDVLQDEGFARLRGKRVAVITNPTGVDGALRSIVDLLTAAPDVRLVAILGPEHGARGASAAGEAVGDDRDRRTGVPVYSLYGKVRRPTREMLAGVDVLLFDIQDIGVRAYTYLATLTEALQAARDSGIELWVLDRPVPIGGDIVEGPVLEAGFESFVGPHQVALRHGLTAGEFALMVNEERGIGARLLVIQAEGWRRDALASGPGAVWIAPSPNIPDLDTAIAYAGTVLIEGTNLSEGRGTTRPFRLVGAPWCDGDRVASDLNARRLPGCLFRPVTFVPWDSKHDGEPCGGVELHITDRRAFRAVTAAVHLIETIRLLHPGKLEIRPATFDRLAGTSSLREARERGAPAEEIVEGWRQEVEGYLARRFRFLLYR